MKTKAQGQNVEVKCRTSCTKNTGMNQIRLDFRLRITDRTIFNAKFHAFERMKEWARTELLSVGWPDPTSVACPLCPALRFGA